MSQIRISAMLPMAQELYAPKEESGRQGAVSGVWTVAGPGIWPPLRFADREIAYAVARAMAQAYTAGVVDAG